MYASSPAAVRCALASILISYGLNKETAAEAVMVWIKIQQLVEGTMTPVTQLAATVPLHPSHIRILIIFYNQYI